MNYAILFYDPHDFEEIDLRYWNMTRLPSRRVRMLWRATR